MIHRSGNPFMQSQHKPIRLNSCASRQVFSARSGITIFSKTTAVLKPRSASPVTPPAGPPNSMTAAVRRFYSKTWSEFYIEDYANP